jgi:hypothetical protein
MFKAVADMALNSLPGGTEQSPNWRFDFAKLSD